MNNEKMQGFTYAQAWRLMVVAKAPAISSEALPGEGVKVRRINCRSAMNFDRLPGVCNILPAIMGC